MFYRAQDIKEMDILDFDSPYEGSHRCCLKGGIMSAYYVKLYKISTGERARGDTLQKVLQGLISLQGTDEGEFLLNRHVGLTKLTPSRLNF